MQSKFNFYDFVGYVIPGALILLLLYWFILGFFNLELLIKVTSIGESLLFLAASYFLGHLIQALGNLIEKKQVEKWGGWFSEQFLRDDNEYYTPEFKSKLKECAQEIFGLSLNSSSEDEQIKKNKRQETFSLCYSLVVQEDAAIHTEIFNGIYSLYRGLLASVWVGVVVSGIISLKHLLWFLFSLLDWTLPKSEFFYFEKLQLELGIAFLIFFIVTIRPLESRFKRFAKHFANSVYRNFYVWCKRIK